MLDGLQHIGDFCDAEDQLVGGATWLRVSWVPRPFATTFDASLPATGTYRSWTEFYVAAVQDNFDMLDHLSEKWFFEEQLDPARLPKSYGVILIQYLSCPLYMQCFGTLDSNRVPRIKCGREWPTCSGSTTPPTYPIISDQAGTSDPEDDRGRPLQRGDPGYRQPWPDHIRPFEIDDPRAHSNRPRPQPNFFATHPRAGAGGFLSAGCFSSTKVMPSPPGAR